MALKFECNQDFRKMKTVKGKKFCEECKCYVYDVRRKSVEKIADLKKELGEVCVLIYDDQLAKAEQLLNAEKKPALKTRSALPYAAGFAALSLLPQLDKAQLALNSTETKAIHSKKEDKITITETKTTSFDGLITKSPKKLSKKHKLILGYYDEERVFVIVKEFNTRSDGSFHFELSATEMELFKANKLEFYSKKFYINTSGFDVESPKNAVTVSISKKIKYRGIFRRHRRAIGGKF